MDVIIEEGSEAAKSGPEMTKENGVSRQPAPVKAAAEPPMSGVDVLRQSALLKDDGVFDGSFAGTALRPSETYIRPWYRRKEYFTEGWTDPSIWRAAVG